MKPITTDIKRLYLDPNNYRFTDKPDYKKVSDKKLTDPQVQKRTHFLLAGRNNELIQDIVISFKENGFLPVNQIQVRELSDREQEMKYLVLEGNRRIATLKYLYEEYKEKEKYRKLVQLHIRYLNRINIFAGKNNSGKTSLLEAVYLLSQLNDINAFLELERYRGKFNEAFNPRWRNVSEGLKIYGKIKESDVSVSLAPQQTGEQIDKTGYISSFAAEAEIHGTSLESNVHIFSGKSPEIFYQKSCILCHAAMTSPYRYNEGLLKKAHSVAVRERFIDDIIGFIRDNTDPDIIRTEMVNIEGESRFYAHTEASDESFDITKYGEGIQRVFEIALLLGYCRNGILCIDEFESAIHKSLADFSRFVHELAERFNVQVFLTTHSKECIDAFIENQYKSEKITAFALQENEDGSVVCKYVEGTRLERLLESIDIDIRGF